MAYSGKYRPQNIKKYRGDAGKIVWRSTWELKFFKYCDVSSNILEWNSEEVVVPYISPVDNKRHRYFIDVWIKYRAVDGSIKMKLIEIKPYVQTQPPKIKKRQSKNYIKQLAVYTVNQAKWKAATMLAEENNMEFVVLTEHELGIAT